MHGHKPMVRQRKDGTEVVPTTEGLSGDVTVPSGEAATESDTLPVDDVNPDAQGLDIRPSSYASITSHIIQLSNKETDTTSSTAGASGGMSVLGTEPSSTVTGSFSRTFNVLSGGVLDEVSENDIRSKIRFSIIC